MAKYNPFNPNSVVIPNLFAGRDLQVNDICKKLAQLKHAMSASFFLYGERGIGKTALARLIRSIAVLNDKDLHGLNLLTSYYSVEEGQDISSVLQESINKLTDEMDATLVQKIGSRLGEIFKNGKFQIGAFGVTLDVGRNKEDELKKEIAIKDQAVSILSNIVKGVEAEKIKDGILIVLDEIHNVRDISSVAAIIRNIVTTLDVENTGRVAFLLVGYPEDMDKFFSKDTSARRTFDIVKLDVMPSGEAAEVLIKGFKAAGVNYDDDALQKNIHVAGGYPHSIQEIGHALIEKDSDNNISSEDWDDALFTASLEMRSKEFSTMYTFSKPQVAADRILVFLAEKNIPMSRKEIGDATGISNVYQYISGLKQTGAVRENDDKKLYLQSQLLRTSISIDQFLRRRKESKD